jgi:hypothetical protein
MGSLSAVAPKLAKLLPLLGSDADGEVVACVHAIRRTLKAEGLDLHALADALRTGTPAASVRGEDDAGNWLQRARWCVAHSDQLSLKERHFVSDMARRRRGGRAPTPRQVEWLMAIYSRLADGR